MITIVQVSSEKPRTLGTIEWNGSEWVGSNATAERLLNTDVRGVTVGIGDQEWGKMFVKYYRPSGIALMYEALKHRPPSTRGGIIVGGIQVD